MLWFVRNETPPRILDSLPFDFSWIILSDSFWALTHQLNLISKCLKIVKRNLRTRKSIHFRVFKNKFRPRMLHLLTFQLYWIHLSDSLGSLTHKFNPIQVSIESMKSNFLTHKHSRFFVFES